MVTTTTTTAFPENERRPREILILFKTHLDLGFTDLAGDVFRRYMDSYIPQALALAKQTRNSSYRFRWTVGSWLFEQYRRVKGDTPELQEAVRQGDIRWHGLPFTTHTEYMTEGLFESGLKISLRLDERYGTRTIAAKMTDVPGHTRAMIPLLVRAGIRFLHLGVNPASTVPEVPALFWWQAPAGEKVLVMYNGDYGEMTAIGQSGAAIYFAHTGDNRGPQDAEQIRTIYEDLHARFPEAILRAGTLEDVAEIALAEEELPVVTSEIGDTWIHGTGTDPAKTSAFRGLLRLAEELPEEAREPVYEALLPVPEHTWGLDEKIHLSATYPVNFQLGEHENFIREDFWEVRKEPRYRLMERSWEEQRAYLRDGCAAFPESFRTRAEKAFAETRREPVSREGMEAISPGENVVFGEFTAAADARGALVNLEWKGRRWADEDHPLFCFLYEVFSQKEFDRFREQYVVSSEEWAVEDFGKIGTEKANDRYRAYSLRNVEIRRSKDSLIITGKAEKEALERFGGAESCELALTFRGSRIMGDFAWFGKKASRVGEACWLGFLPEAPLQAIHKLGAWLDPMDVVPGGNRQMHVTQAGVRWEGLTLRGIDTGLISIGSPSLLNFSRALPDPRGGIWFNLHNNVWGTNFPMWYDQDARFRFTLNFAEREK